MRKLQELAAPLPQVSFLYNRLGETRPLKQRQRLSAVLIAAALLFVMAACGGGTASPPPPPPAAAPTISSFAPTSGAAGSNVTITGTNLTGATAVKFNGTAASSFSVSSATQITATVANGTTTGKIAVTTPGGTATSANSFTVLLLPTISGFNPASGLAGTPVTITGTNFTGATAVAFNGTAAASFSVNSATQITATVANGTTNGKITVTTPGGTATSASNFTVLIPPTISGFNPTSGLVGTAVTITGTNFTGTTAVAFNSKAAANFTVNSATQITATVASGTTTGKITVTTPGGTATSATNFTVTTPPEITIFNPGSGPVGTPVVIQGTSFNGAIAVAFNGTAATSFSVNSATQITATVANGTTTGKITVTTPSGTATSASNFTVTNSSATLDLTIDGLYVTQATQDYPNPSVPLVQNRSAWVRVFVRANETNAVAPQVKVDFIKGATTNTLTINSGSSSVPLNVDTENAGASWNAAVSASWIQAGTQVVATVDPTNAIPEADETNNQFTENFDVRNLKVWKITVVPVHTGDGRLGVVGPTGHTPADWVDFAKRIHPVPDAIDAIVGSVMNSSVTTLQSGGTGWGTVLNEVTAKRSADGATDRYYYGAVHPNYNSGVAGLGWIGQPAAIGWDLGTTGSGSFPQVLAHEVGHNFNRQHSPCGNPDGPDPNYPYPGAIIGVPGWDVFAASNNLKGSSTYVDVMSYCSPLWISDYTYSGELTFRQGSSIGIIVPPPDQSTGLTEGLLVWGRIENGQVTLEPAFRIPANNSLAEPGPYTWEARDAVGQVLASVSFNAPEVADLPERSLRLFSFVVPLKPEVLAAVRSTHVKSGDQELTSRIVSPVQAADLENTLFLQDLPNHGLQVVWDADRYPMLMLRDARTGELRGFLRGGSAQVVSAPDEVEIQGSDGIGGAALRHRRIEE